MPSKYLALASTLLLLSACGSDSNPAPVAVDTNIATMEDQSSSSIVQANDPDGEALTATIDNPPSKGTVAVTVTGSGPITFVYTPAAGKTGSDSFTYHVSDANASSRSATVNVVITPVPPVVTDQSFAVSENTVVSDRIAMTGPAGETLALAVTGPASHGTVQLIDAASGQFKYTPAPDYNGSDSFQVTASDSVSNSRPATISVQIAAVDGPAAAQPDDFVVPATGTTMLDVLANDTDAEDAAITISVVQQPAGATATVSGNKIAFTPNPNSGGMTRFTYRLTDAAGVQSTALVRVVIGSMTPLVFLADNDTPGIFELYLTDHFSTRKLSGPLPPGYEIAGYEISANGKSLVYVTGNHTPPYSTQMWLLDLTNSGSAPTPVTLPSPSVSFLQISPDGNYLAFSGTYVNLSRPSQPLAIPSQGSVDRVLFSTDSQKLYFSVILSGGGRVIDRASINPQSGPSGPTQLTQTYGIAEGLGIGFVSTPDDTRIVSTGLFLLFPTVGPSQQAFVTPTSPPFSDQRLSPPLTNTIDNADQPIVSADSHYALYTATVGGVSGVYANDLTNPGAAVPVDTAATGWYVGGLQISPDSRTVFYSKGPLNSPSSPSMMYTNISQPGMISTFNPLGTAAVPPRRLSIAPNGTAVAFDSGTNVYLSPWGHFDSATLILALDGSAGIPHFSYSADSNALAIAAQGIAPRLSVSSPKTGDVYVATSATATGVRCFSFVGSGCWF
jgi:hypothetical protein